MQALLLKYFTILSNDAVPVRQLLDATEPA
jgi:hypothetical protein